MTVNELILKIDEILNLGLDGSVTEQNADCKALLNCCNFVLDELYADAKYNRARVNSPVPLTFESEATLPDSKITARIFIYGVIAEYFRIAGDYSQSVSWTEKYVNALSVAFSSKTTARLPSRRWL